MQPPKKFREKILEHISGVINEGQQTLSGLENKDRQIGWDSVTSFQTQFLMILELFPSVEHYQKLAQTYGDEMRETYQLRDALGHLKGVKKNLEGNLTNLEEVIEGAIISDYMEQAEQLLGEGISGQYDYVPAAVLAGAVLEDALRRLCTRRTPSISINKHDGRPKTMGTLIDDLKGIGLFNELKAKQLRAWADIRNAAAHGRFNDFTRADVDQMLSGIENFLADYL